MKTDQVTEAHHARVAYVYLRQSSTQQVLHHTESQRRQRGLVQRAMALGWRSDRTVLIDEDLGQSAGRTGQRSGFERLLGEVAIGKVGFILFAGGLAYFQGESQLVPSARHLRGHPYADWRDLPGLWEAPTTRAQDKKRLIRCLVAQVVVCVPEEDAPLKADVHWVGGEVTCIQVSKGRTGGHRYVTEAEIVELVRSRYQVLWDELTREEEFPSADMWRIGRRIERLNDLGFDVDELDIVTDFDGDSVRIQPKVVELGHHCRELLGLVGMNAEEAQARRILNDIAAYTAHYDLGREDRSLVANRWMTRIFEPIMAMIPPAARGKLEPAEIFHEILEHRWYLSEDAGQEVAIFDAARDYIDTELSRRPEEAVAIPGSSPAGSP